MARSRATSDSRSRSRRSTTRSIEDKLPQEYSSDSSVETRIRTKSESYARSRSRSPSPVDDPIDDIPSTSAPPPVSYGRYRPNWIDSAKVSIKDIGATRFSKTSRAHLIFSVPMVQNTYMEKFNEPLSDTAAVYLAAVIQYMTSEVLDHAEYHCNVAGRTKILPEDIRHGINQDKEMKRYIKNCNSIDIFMPTAATAKFELAYMIAERQQSDVKQKQLWSTKMNILDNTECTVRYPSIERMTRLRSRWMQPADKKPRTGSNQTRTTATTPRRDPLVTPGAFHKPAKLLNPIVLENGRYNGLRTEVKFAGSRTPYSYPYPEP